MTLNLRKTLAVGGTAVAIIGIGGTALATSGSDTPSSKNSSSSSAPDTKQGKHEDGKQGKHGKQHKLLKRLEHGQFTTKGKDGAVTHTIFRGTVTAVSPTSITVQSADKKSQAYTVGKDTKIRERTKGKKPATTTISKIAKGDQVVVAGTGTSKVTANQIVEFAKK